MANREKDNLDSSADGTGEAESGPVEPRAPFASWLFLLVGLVAGGLAIPAGKIATTEFADPLPDEYYELRSTYPTEQPRELIQKVITIAKKTEDTNHGRFLMVLGATMAVTFGWGAGFIHGRILFGIIGAALGAAVAIGIGMSAPRLILDLQKTAIDMREHRDFYSMSVYASQWLLFGIPVALAVGIAAGRVTTFIKSAGIVFMAAILGSVVYVIFGTLLNSTLTLTAPTPHDGPTGYLWACASPVLMGLFLARTRL